MNREAPNGPAAFKDRRGGFQWRARQDITIERNVDNTLIRVSSNHSTVDLFIMPVVIVFAPLLFLLIYALRYHESLILILYFVPGFVPVALLIFFTQPPTDVEIYLTPEQLVYISSDFRRRRTRTWMRLDIIKLSLRHSYGRGSQGPILQMDAMPEPFRLLPSFRGEILRAVALEIHAAMDVPFEDYL